MYESTDKNVSHPEHYKAKNGMETIDVITAFTDGLSGIDAVDTGNVLKYVCRWNKKNDLQDLEKAQWYLTHLIERKRNECNPESNIKRDSDEVLDDGDAFTIYYAGSEEAAKDICTQLLDIQNSLGVVRVADLLDLAGYSRRTGTFLDKGWHDVNKFGIHKSATKYYIVTPVPEILTLTNK